MHPKQPQFADVANVSPSKCYDGPLLGRSSFLIKDDSSARDSGPIIFDNAIQVIHSHYDMIVCADRSAPN
ncbi:hypothetical protein CDAR_313281 [Caerostris darwini]|uniref:Uncharacterized protein n=1 Tax=Caerostris darwini TaxID=1538125 RepID=A0AAV4QJR2_9ARAC|nr:hypothetical protein CDAR_313281 [Caerostris darwini]